MLNSKASAKSSKPPGAPRNFTGFRELAPEGIQKKDLATVRMLVLSLDPSAFKNNNPYKRLGKELDGVVFDSICSATLAAVREKPTAVVFDTRGACSLDHKRKFLNAMNVLHSIDRGMQKIIVDDSGFFLDEKGIPMKYLASRGSVETALRVFLKE